VLDLLCELQREAKLTMIIATHDDRVAARAHATLRLADGLIA
jgi:predicted ABC-type transport system involved in lysophospholipase L1 biosynthesis ATPase subunit